MVRELLIICFCFYCSGHLHAKSSPDDIFHFGQEADEGKAEKSKTKTEPEDEEIDEPEDAQTAKAGKAVNQPLPTAADDPIPQDKDFIHFDMKVGPHNPLVDTSKQSGVLGRGRNAMDGNNRDWFDDVRDDALNISQIQHNAFKHARWCQQKKTTAAEECQKAFDATYALDIYADRFDKAAEAGMKSITRGDGRNGEMPNGKISLNTDDNRMTGLRAMRTDAAEFKKNANIALGGLTAYFKSTNNDTVLSEVIKESTQQLKEKKVLDSEVAGGEARIPEGTLLEKSQKATRYPDQAASILYNITGVKSTSKNDEVISKFLGLTDTPPPVEIPDNLLTTEQINTINNKDGSSAQASTQSGNGSNIDQNKAAVLYRGVKEQLANDIQKNNQEFAKLLAEEQKKREKEEQEKLRKAAAGSNDNNSGASSDAGGATAGGGGMSGSSLKGQDPKEKEREKLREEWRKRMEDSRKYGRKMLDENPSRSSRDKGSASSSGSRYRIPRLYRRASDDDSDNEDSDKSTARKRRPYGDSKNAKKGPAEQYAYDYYNKGNAPDSMTPSEFRRKRFGDMMNFARRKSLTENANVSETAGRYIDLFELLNVILDHLYRDRGEIVDDPKAETYPDKG
ncbi:MAG: hypothetical protein JXA66_06385 [Oligoflexia bacterium]|nr:hypothetical protein [Oligoflexia bacterium]